jgi:hypothetical protein
MSLISKSTIFSEENKWNAIVSLSSMAAAYTARKIMERTWTAAAGKEPPKNPSNWTVSWGEAISYMAVAGALSGIVRVFAIRGATLGWKKASGSFPPEARKLKKKWK